MIIIFLPAHFLLRAIPQVVMFCFLACKKLKHISLAHRFPSKCTNSSAGFMTTIFLLAQFLLQAIPQVAMFCFSSLQKNGGNNHWLIGFQRIAPTLQLGL
jgi:hypothetical protein